MRIVGGEFKGHRFNPPGFFKARPTTDFAKESLFNLINNLIDLENCKALDLFTGTGSISYEFLSRGCTTVCSVDISNKYLGYVKKTAELLSPTNKIIRTIKSDVLKFIPKHTLDYDIIFADPPYDLKDIEKIPDLIYNNTTLNQQAIVIVEHSSETDFTAHPHFKSIRSYGKVNFSFFE